MSGKKQSYRYRPQKEYVTLPWHKELGKRIERWNKVATLRLLGRLLGVKRRSSPLPLESVSSVLFIRYDALGDMIVTTPLWRILKRVKPGIRVGVAGSFKNLDLLRTDSDVDVLYDYSAASLREILEISKKTRERDWDVVIMCNFNQKTRNSIIAQKATRDGYTATAGSANLEGHQALFSWLVPMPVSTRPMTMTQQLQYLLRSVITLPAGPSERPSIRIDPAAERETVIRIAEILAKEGRSKYVLVNTDAPAFKRWGTQNNLRLAEYIVGNFSEYVVMFTALPEYAEELRSELALRTPERTHYFPTADIHEMCVLIRHSSLVVTPDTSIVHLASAEAKPVVAFYLAAGEWLPYKIPAYILLPPKGDAIATIPVESVCEGVQTMLSSEDSEQSGKQRIVYCGNPQANEVVEFSLTEDTAAQA